MSKRFQFHTSPSAAIAFSLSLAACAADATRPASAPHEPTSLPEPSSVAAHSTEDTRTLAPPTAETTSVSTYPSRVLASSQRPLVDHKAFAYYLNAIHDRIHPLFADQYLTSLKALPTSDPRNVNTLFTRVELAIAPDGSIAQIGIVHPSSVTDFDASAVDAFKNAAPFGPTPQALRSSDGNVWLQWEMHRDEVFACSTINAWPYRLAFDAPIPAHPAPLGTP